MPPAIIAAVIGAAATATDIGLQASGALAPSTSGQEKALMASEQKQQEALKQQEAQAFKRFAPDVQSATGGALTDRSFAQMVAELAGQPGDIGLAQQTVFGTQTGSGLAS
jgi:hypothetical protein